MDFGLDPLTGDLIVEGGMTKVTGAEELLQKINIGLTINLGEFFSHINYGLPWTRNATSELVDSDVQYFLGESDSTSVQYIVKELTSFLLAQDNISSVTSSYSFDKTTRTLTYTPEIVGNGGEVLSFKPYTLEI